MNPQTLLEAVSTLDGRNFIESIEKQLQESFKSENVWVHFPPMNSYERMLIHEMAKRFEMESHSEGEGDDRHVVVCRTAKSRIPALDLADIATPTNPYQDDSEEDWEKLADALPPIKAVQPVKRGRGQFKRGVESVDYPTDEKPQKPSRFLELYDFDPSLRTQDIELIVKNAGFAVDDVKIRWINDTTLVLVFQSPADTEKAHQCIQLNSRHVHDSSTLMSSISGLAAPAKRPDSDPTAARRMIASALRVALPRDGTASEMRAARAAARAERERKKAAEKAAKQSAWED